MFQVIQIWEFGNWLSGVRRGDAIIYCEQGLWEVVSVVHRLLNGGYLDLDDGEANVVKQEQEQAKTRNRLRIQSKLSQVQY
jgi:hypothetical protein